MRHSVPPGFPGAGQAAPAAKSNNEIGPWVAAAKRGPQSPVPATATNSAPPKTPLHPPVITVISGDAESTGKAVPAVALVPVQPVPVPPIDSLPPILPPGTEPKALDLKQPPGPDNPGKTADPMGKGPPELYPSVLTIGSDPASEYLKALESGQTGYRLKLDQAIELGLFNAREYQDRREDLYLIALPVTLERFNFAAQAFFTEQVIRESTGRQLANGGERWSLNTTGGVNKLFPTGAMLMVKLANQITIDLSGDKPQTSISNLSLSLMQPFLRGGGFAVTLEDLTQAERTLVYAMRSYTRFRKLFYVALAAGGSGGGYTNNPYGLQGLSPNLGRGIGGNLTAPNIGYLPLLQQSATLNNQRKNVVALERLLQLYQAFREGGQQSDLQVGQVEVQLLTNRSQLLGSANTGASQSGIRGFLDSLDNFKLQLGLPITVPLELDDGPLRPIRQQLGRFEEVYAQVQQTELAAAKYDPAEPVAQFRARWRNLLTDSALVKGTPFAKSIGERLDSWAPAKLTDDQAATRLAQLREERRKLLAARADRQVKGLPEPEADTRKIALLEDDIDLGDFERLVRIYESQPWTKVTTPTARATAQAAAFRDVFNSFYQLILEGRNDRLTAVRSQWPTLPPLTVGDTGTDVLVAPLDDAYTAAIQTALTNRLDLMNARGQVVDAWRQIAIQANSLQGVFNVRYDLSSNTPAGRNNGLAFAADRSNHQLVFNAELPLVRRAERNNYRAALIGYQRQRRTLMAFEDNITNDVRSDLRELRTLAQLYRIQQRVVELGYSQVDNAQAILLAPPAPGAANDAGSAAALTQQVLDAQNRLVTAQNTLFQLWVAYQIGRMQLYVDLEQMTLDDRGVWIDEFFNRTDAQNRSPADGQRPGERLHAPQPVGAGGK
ncbi:hypothetical protein VT84_26400 [Gemmata sp. SH-PL17]|uniref:TolC family protein n=1 Tax=Gemmata sp. SH-PL17 TaxID=1630693 RepID=UPI00078BEF7C|nr:TolC family protein [Gemmata sp. SH-PL17]AMV27963.1 hypothetical protein VT84_26400 [Gemmata sp. SH-PL17]